MTVVNKAKGGQVTLRFETTGFANLGQVNAIGETVTSMRITDVLWSANGGAWLIKRGANTVLKLNGNGIWPLRDNNIVVDNVGGESAANIQCILTAGSGSLVIKLAKDSTTFTRQY